MNGRIRIDGAETALDRLGDEARALADRIAFTDRRIAELEALQAVLLRAKNAYIADLRAEIVTARSGVDLSALLDG